MALVSSGYLSAATRARIKTAAEQTFRSFARSYITIFMPDMDTLEEHDTYQEPTAAPDNYSPVSAPCVKFLDIAADAQGPMGQVIDCDAIAQCWVADIEAAGLTITPQSEADKLTLGMTTLDQELFKIDRAVLLDGNMIAGEFWRVNLHLNRVNLRDKRGG